MAKYTYTDIDLTLSKKRNGDLNELSGIDAVKSSIDNIISTMRGDRRMLPGFAGRLQNYLFEPLDEVTAYSIGEEVISAIEEWDSRVVIENININPNYESNRYDITVTFRIRNSRKSETEQLETILQRG